VRIEWSPAARASARRYMEDQDGMRAIGAAIAALALDPYPPEGFHLGEYHRLRVGRFRVIYVVEDDLITVERVDQG
jgi:mRNA-degrading endonuclease RelE of RelBE toxin-antitoxin system